MNSFPVPRVDSLPPFALLAIVAFAIALVLFVASLLLLGHHRKAKNRPTPVRRGRHSNKPADRWHKQVQKIRNDFHAGRLSSTQAYSALSLLARTFASQRLGADFSSLTLLDLNRRHQLSSKEQFTRLRQTIAALYPPEFAPPTNAQVRQTSVDEAADWVDDLLGRWKQ